VIGSLTPFGYRVREQLFISWAGLRGAVPIVLATFALSAKVEGSETIFNAVFFVVLVSTLAQGLTLEWFARTLGLATEEQPHGCRAKSPPCPKGTGKPTYRCLTPAVALQDRRGRGRLRATGIR
jgi:potassium/hydrogen antiporter